LIEKEAELLGLSSRNREIAKLKLSEMSPEDKRKSVYGDKK